MFNSYGWIQLGMNRKNIDFLDEDLQIQFDQYDRDLVERILEMLSSLKDKNEIINYDFVETLNNLDNFLSVQLSRNHFSSSLRDFYMEVAKISDGSHGVLYEMNDEESGFNPDKPYKVWRLIGNNFEEYEETMINEKYYQVNY